MSEPAGVMVAIDGDAKGFVPDPGVIVIGGLSVGNHVITASLTGYQPSSPGVYVNPNSVVKTRITLASCIIGTLEVSSTPPGATSYLDNQYADITPLTIPAISPGFYLRHHQGRRVPGPLDDCTCHPLRGGYGPGNSCPKKPTAPATQVKTPLTPLTAHMAVDSAILMRRH
jgi:hypothetical protein